MLGTSRATGLTMADRELDQWMNRNIPPESMDACDAILPVKEQHEILDTALERHYEETGENLE